MFTDIAIWNPPPPPVHYRVEGASARAQRDYTDAEYAPAKTYSKAVVAASHANRGAVESVVPVSVCATAVEFGSAQSGIRLYASIANYRPPAPPLVSVRV